MARWRSVRTDRAAHQLQLECSCVLSSAIRCVASGGVRRGGRLGTRARAASPGSVEAVSSVGLCCARDVRSAAGWRWLGCRARCGPSVDRRPGGLGRRRAASALGDRGVPCIGASDRARCRGGRRRDARRGRRRRHAARAAAPPPAGRAGWSAPAARPGPRSPDWRAERLGQDVLDTRGFDHGAHRAAGDHACARRRRLEQHLARRRTSERSRAEWWCPAIGTRIRFLRARSAPLRIESGTSLALPRPTPTWPEPSPTTTTALKRKASAALDDLGHAIDLDDFLLEGDARRARSVPVGACFSKLQPAFPRGVGQRSDAPVVQISAAIEDDGADALVSGTLGDSRADGACPLGLRADQRCRARGLVGAGGGQRHAASCRR